MKKVLAILLVMVLAIGAFLLSNKIKVKENDDITIDVGTNSEIQVSTTTSKNSEEKTTENNKKLSRNDFYLYKEEWDGLGGYTYRPDGQILTISNASGIESVFTYDDNGLIVAMSDNYFGVASFDYENSNGYHLGTASFDDSNVFLKYLYNEDYKLIKREQISDSDYSSFDIVYNDDGSVYKTIETDWLTTTKEFGNNGILVKEDVLNSNARLIEQKEYDSEGRLCSHVCLEEGEIYQYSEFKTEGDKYIEYIFDIRLPDSHYEAYGLPIGSYNKYVERKYDEYGNLISEAYYLGSGMRDSAVNYEYKLK